MSERYGVDDCRISGGNAGKTWTELEASLAAAVAEIDTLGLDAARYRWLRTRARSETAMDRWHGYMWGINGIHDPHHEGFDTAVDAAMQLGQEHTK